MVWISSYHLPSPRHLGLQAFRDAANWAAAHVVPPQNDRPASIPCANHTDTWARACSTGDSFPATPTRTPPPALQSYPPDCAPRFHHFLQCPPYRPRGDFASGEAGAEGHRHRHHEQIIRRSRLQRQRRRQERGSPILRNNDGPLQTGAHELRGGARHQIRQQRTKCRECFSSPNC
jgi:hypothetical protein